MQMADDPKVFVLDNKKNIWKSRSNAALIAAVIAFAFSQVLIVAHTAKYGDGPHDHHGQACVLSLAAPGGDKIIAAASFVFAAIASIWRISHQAEQTAPARVAIRAARPRGPPSQ